MADVALFLSPHLDDAVLSCPGRIQRLAGAGSRVVVATVFTEADAAAATLYRNRRAEDKRAVRSLGATPLHLGFLDAPYRSAEYRDFREIVFGEAAEYAGTCRRVTEEIRTLVGRLQARTVLGPLAAGNHVDHRLARDAALAAVETSRLLFYEDRPYAFVREQVRHVLGKSMAAKAARFWRRYFEVTYVRTYLGGTSRDEVIGAWSRVPPFPRQYRLRKAETVVLRPSEWARATEAIRLYRTQIDDLFSGEMELNALYRENPETLYRVRRSMVGNDES
ncbi:MAG: PIG-L family deacetylase [Bryobacteraceae bacterium]|nr:PIG-L family deacetylase [Bryobacteraceae bacterium]